MNEVYVDLRKLDLADRLGKDMITIDALLRELENALDEIVILKDEIKNLQDEDYGKPDAYDEWRDRE